MVDKNVFSCLMVFIICLVVCPVPFFSQMPEEAINVPVHSVGGGLGVDVSAPSVEVGASLPSTSGGLPGESKALGLPVVCSYVYIFLCGACWVSRTFGMHVYETTTAARLLQKRVL